ncbi:DUF2931 family protein [Chryseobacterium oryctis]|uniref:DUF2931 family protein n=1 Tax=Chryseobacterium oryctis TaxID=2952618 RepID=A0ABT3HS26_9FLAO|nr:DUF2931 family protein [Chryseobacterium oryctis]MCW3162490.1 DUF2931 family protein [Chryseobacterium oryctis]
MRTCYLLLLFLSLLSCQPKDKFSWNAGWSAPKYYGASPFVEYFYKGKSIAGTSANIGADPGWGITSGGYTGGDIYKDVPDSIYVKWLCSADGYYYEGGKKLPRERMLSLFKEKTIDTYTGAKADYSLIVAGMAPGGNVSIWMQGGTTNKEIEKFKVPNKGVWQENDKEYQKGEKETASSKDFINSEANIFRNLHGIPYSVWEKGEKEYNYDIGFVDKSKKINPSITNIITKDGSIFQYFNQSTSIYSIDTLTNSSNKNLSNNNLKKKNKLPVQMELKWKKRNSSNYYYRSIIVLPQDFESKFDFGENRLIIETLDDDFGNLYLLNFKGKQDIMKFKFDSYNNSDHRVIYSLPKGFVFPKWEGREKLTFPEIDYWQEK